MSAKKKRKEEIKAPFIPKIDNDFKNKVEALLFASGRPLDIDFITGVIGSTEKSEVKKALNELKKEYDDKNSSLMIIEDGNAWKITVREKYLPLVRKIVADTELSKSVMETLAVIAWKSPALQSDIIKIRTNKAYDHIDELLETDFITKEKKGRSFILKVTNKFYEYFDVEGKEGIREIFSKIQEKPIQKKVDEFKENAQKKLGSLKIISSPPDDSIKKAEEKMEERKVGGLEVYDEGKPDEKEDEKDIPISSGNNAINKISLEIKQEKAKNDEDKDWYDEDDEETLKAKTKKIVKDLLQDDKKKPKKDEVVEEE